MRRILSVILAIAMVATLMPAAFAADTETDAGITLTYEVTKNFGAWSKDDVKFSTFTYEASNGLWEYYGNTNNLPSIDKSTTINWAGTDGMQMRAGWWAIKINVPKSGVYTPKINWRAYKEAAILNLHLVRKDGDLTTEDITDDNLIGSIDCYNADCTAVTTQTPKALDARYIEAGEYYFVYSTGKKTSPGGTGWVFFGNISLDGNGTDTVLASIIEDKAEAIPSGQKLNPTLYMSDGTAASGAYELSYTSDNAAVTVSDDGTVRVGSGESANITITAVNEAGYTIKAVDKVRVVNGATIKYDLKKHVSVDLAYYEGRNVGSLSAVDETLTNGFYSYFGGNDYNGSAVKYYSSVQIMGTGVKIAFKVNVPEAGYYAFMQDVYSTTTARQNCDISVYINKDAISTAAADLVGKTNAYKPEIANGTLLCENVGTVYFEEAGSYIVTFCMGPKLDSTQSTQFGLVCSFYLVGGEKTALMNGKIATTASEINVDEGETATVSATGFLSKDATAATFTYSSDNTSVATVDATTGVVTPVKAGKATITATANAEVANKLTADITVTENKPGEEVADPTVNFTALAETGGTVTDQDKIKNVAIGSSVTVEATADEGYEFAYWRNASGKHLSSSAKETFKVNTNTSVIAVFDKVAVSEEDITVPVYFYNENGSLIEKKNVEKGNTFGDAKNGVETSLTGHRFDKWSISDNTVVDKLLRAVALYNKDETKYKVTVGGEEVASGAYGDTVTVKGGENFKCWKLGNNVASFDKEYSFLIWGDITLTEVTEGEIKTGPTVAINQNGDNYFIAYNVPTGYTLIEAGIVFAKSGEPTIGSFHSKAVAKTGSGQFTAKSGDGTENVARGYVMFRDGEGNIRVIYAK